MLKVESNPKIMKGKPVIAGARFTVESILERLSLGETREQIIETHPHISDEAISAALTFAGSKLKSRYS